MITKLPILRPLTVYDDQFVELLYDCPPATVMLSHGLLQISKQWHCRISLAGVQCSGLELPRPED